MKIQFSQKPNRIDYRTQFDGAAEVWLYKNIKQTEEGFEADGVFFKTMLSEEEVLNKFDSYFAEGTKTDPIEELKAENEMLTQCILELASIIYA